MLHVAVNVIFDVPYKPFPCFVKFDVGGDIHIRLLSYSDFQAMLTQNEVQFTCDNTWIFPCIFSEVLLKFHM
jgi:hypothetical protein